MQLLVVVVLLVLIFSIFFPAQFATVSNLQNVTRQGAILLVVAIGQAFALIVGGFDISVGANMGFSGTVAALVMLSYGVVAGAVAGLVAATVVGLLNGILIAKVGVSPFVATLGMLTLIHGLANQLSNGASVSGLPASFSILGADDWGPIPSTAAMAAVVMVLAWFILSNQRLGLYIYAIGGSRETCVLAGIPVARYEIVAYTICGFLAGVGGIMLASRVFVGQASLGNGYELLSIATAVIGGVAIGGGVGRLFGVLLGVAIVVILTTGMDIAGVSEFVREITEGVVLIAAVIFNIKTRGQGLGALTRMLTVRASRR
jgi:ribose transport system permease protein